MGICRKSRILDPCDAVVGCQELSYLLGISAVACHTYGQRLEADLDVVSVLGRLDGAEVSHELGCSLCDVSSLAELGGICEAVVRLVGCAETRELVSVSHPVEVAGVNNGAAYG